MNLVNASAAVIYTKLAASLIFVPVGKKNPDVWYVLVYGRDKCGLLQTGDFIKPAYARRDCRNDRSHWPSNNVIYLARYICGFLEGANENSFRIYVFFGGNILAGSLKAYWLTFLRPLIFKELYSSTRFLGLLVLLGDPLILVLRSTRFNFAVWSAKVMLKHLFYFWIVPGWWENFVELVT